ncbi:MULTISPECIES: GNAT family N-acetyltransferase [unclassified Gemella]|uniref:GNAT family N-acetyltransferase n=1 Tax=unclassified Gemella TaxID=2624949 RepID=UPI0014310CDD|nr:MULTISPECIES: GNAT family N-acetyltransferase [unclassified Gemella]MBF0710497.1 N-acetyltransferase [Gemella sp. GL1.1]MBF0746562.1 N-acetyltransferase [Gemella sp. 19428wG2_WT2a]NYS27841.1 N-acetyltransferase [Gemella sp. GL1]
MEFKINKEEDFLYLGPNEYEAKAYIMFPKNILGTNTIIKVFVSEEYRGQGLASKMMEYLYQYAKENKIILDATCSYAKSWLSNVR